MKNCNEVECALVEISLPSILSNHELTKNINNVIESSASRALSDDNSTAISLEKVVQDFDIEYHNIKNEFPEETSQYEASIDGFVSFQNENLACIELQSYLFSGGAHGYANISYINIDTRTGEKISNLDLLKEVEAFKNYAENVFRKEYKIPENESINSTGFFFEKDTFALPSAIGFTKEDVLLYYNQYEISSYTEGAVELTLNKEKVAHFFAYDIK
ncbi:RsiV family protein [Aquimarina pacifica]|uniref:RsiV family protein n=1 Tax=Aquimarina pacifica TaxID=1296415 RepID=UPI00046EB192|nr:RsiV family protein [Aquimarina pacifica]